MDWAEALEKWSELTGPKEGFYVSQQARNNKYTAVLCVSANVGTKKEKMTKKDIMFQIYRSVSTIRITYLFISTVVYNLISSHYIFYRFTYIL